MNWIAVLTIFLLIGCQTSTKGGAEVVSFVAQSSPTLPKRKTDKWDLMSQEHIKSLVRPQKESPRGKATASRRSVSGGGTRSSRQGDILKQLTVDQILVAAGAPPPPPPDISDQDCRQQLGETNIRRRKTLERARQMYESNKH